MLFKGGNNSETKWIPVSEKLPEKECDCLVIAWIPLPEPYKPESEVEE